jgi:hypothetical protein
MGGRFFAWKRPEMLDILFTCGPINAIYKLMPATLTRDQMRLYQRERRARLKAEREASEPVVDAAIPRNALLKESDKDLSRMWAKAAAIGPGAVITKTHGRLDVLRRADFEARTASPVPPTPTPAPRSAVARYEPPRSMVAIGGKPGKGLIPQASGYALPPDLAAASPFTRAEEFRAQTTAMLAALAAKSDEQERRIVALETAAADRRANAIEFVQAAFGLFSFAVRR